MLQARRTGRNLGELVGRVLHRSRACRRMVCLCGGVRGLVRCRWSVRRSGALQAGTGVDRGTSSNSIQEHAWSLPTAAAVLGLVSTCLASQTRERGVWYGS